MTELEVQRADDGARPERARYHAGALDVENLNASYKGEDPLGLLMHDFLCSDPDDMFTKLLAEKARYLKSDPKGVDLMCKVMEDLREESIQRGIDQNRVESIKNLMKNVGWTLQQAMDALEIPASEQPKYASKI